MYHHKTFPYIYNWVPEAAAYLTLVIGSMPLIMLVIFFCTVAGFRILYIIETFFLFALGSS